MLIEARPWDPVLAMIEDTQHVELRMYYVAAAFFHETQGDDSSLGDIFLALHKASSPRLTPNNWCQPFAPMSTVGDKRTAIPDDMNATELEVIAKVVPLIEYAPLRAQFADIAWTYGKRDSIELALLAIESYIKVPLDENWITDGEHRWSRAFELAIRLGKAASDRLSRMREMAYDKLRL